MSNGIANRISQAESLKEEGNLLYKNENYEEAVKKYVKIFLYVKGLEIPDMARMIGQQASQELSDSQSAHITSILVAANSNLAMCHLKLKNYSKVIKFASKAIEMDSKHQKARFRRALAYIEVKDIDAARADLNIALDQCPQDKAIIRALKRLDVVERNLNLSAQRKLAGIFDRVDLS